VLAQPNPDPAPATPTAPPASLPRGHYLHDGFYLRYALGPSTWQLRGTATSGSAEYAGGAFGEILAIGGTIPNGFVIAGAASAAISSMATIGNYGVLIDWFPNPKDGWHLGGLLGLGLVRAPAPLVFGPAIAGMQTSSGGGNLEGFGLGATLIGGYDLWITPQCSLGLEAVAATTTPAAMRDSSGNASGYQFTPLWFGLFASILYH
jgi:hypothetical protein